MTNRIRNVLVADYLQRFECIGARCEDSCCQGWEVEIDEATAHRYHKVKDPELTPLFREKLATRRAPGSSATPYCFSMDSQGHCPFWDSDKLCKIQKRLGSEELSYPCARYPREENQVLHVRERAATFSCPEAARLALLTEKPIEFKLIDEKSDRFDRYFRRAFPEPGVEEPPYAAHFWKARIFSITLLQARSIPLTERVLILGEYANMLDTLVASEYYDEISLSTDTLLQSLQEGHLTASTITQRDGTVMQEKLLTILCQPDLVAAIRSPRFSECHAALEQGLHSGGAAVLREAITNHLKPFFRSHHYLFENYLVNQTFKNLFPFGEGRQVKHAYRMLLLPFVVINTYLALGANAIGTIHYQQAIKIIQSFTKSFEHHSDYRERLIAALGAIDLSDVATMATLMEHY
jgi:lysine-N-methylase